MSDNNFDEKTDNMSPTLMELSVLSSLSELFNTYCDDDYRFARSRNTKRIRSFISNALTDLDYAGNYDSRDSSDEALELFAKFKKESLSSAESFSGLSFITDMQSTAIAEASSPFAKIVPLVKSLQSKKDYAEFAKEQFNAIADIAQATNLANRTAEDKQIIAGPWAEIQAQKPVVKKQPITSAFQVKRMAQGEAIAEAVEKLSDALIAYHCATPAPHIRDTINYLEEYINTNLEGALYAAPEPMTEKQNKLFSEFIDTASSLEQFAREAFDPLGVVCEMMQKPEKSKTLIAKYENEKQALFQGADAAMAIAAYQFIELAEDIFPRSKLKLMQGTTTGQKPQTEATKPTEHKVLMFRKP